MARKQKANDADSQRRAEKATKPEAPKPKVKKPKPKRTLKKGVKVSFYAFLLLVILGASSYISYDYLRLETVSIVGNKTVDGAELIAISKLARGESMLKINTQDVAQSIALHPKIIVDSVTLRYPNAIDVVVEERQNVAYISHLSSFITLDKYGVILEVLDKPPEESLISVTGLSVSGYTVGEELGLHDEFQLSVMLNVLNSLLSSPQAQLFKGLDMRNPIDMRLISKNDIAVLIGTDENLEKKLENAQRVLTELEGETGGVLNVIDLNSATYSPPPSPSPPPEGEAGEEGEEGEQADPDAPEGEQEDQEQPDPTPEPSESSSQDDNEQQYNPDDATTD